MSSLMEHYKNWLRNREETKYESTQTTIASTSGDIHIWKDMHTTKPMPMPTYPIYEEHHLRQMIRKIVEEEIGRLLSPKVAPTDEDLKAMEEKRLAAQNTFKVSAYGGGGGGSITTNTYSNTLANLQAGQNPAIAGQNLNSAHAQLSGLLSGTAKIK